MILRKHRKFLRRFAGNIARKRYGAKSGLVKLAKLVYLFLEWLIEAICDILFLGKKRPTSPIGAPRRILVVKLDQLGDVLFSTFLLPLIKRAHPQVEIDYLVNPKARGVLEGNPHVAGVYFWEDIFLEFLPGRGRVSQVFQKMRRNRATKRLLKERHYDAVLNARGFPPSSNVFWRGLGGSLVSFDISEQSFLADYQADYDLDAEEWKNYLNLLVPLGVDISRAEFREEFYNNKGENPMADTKKYAVISPVTFDRDRRWGDDNWKELISFMASKGMAIALTGTAAQETYLKGLAAGGGGRVKICTGMSLTEFGALMKGASFFVGIDSFPAHLALASGKRSFFFVNTDVYFLKGYSRERFANDARSILPILSSTTAFNVASATVQEVEGSLANAL